MIPVRLVLVLLAAFWAARVSMPVSASAATQPKKPHIVALGTIRSVPYSKAGDPAGAGSDETVLKTRALMVDGRVSEWTTGEVHEVTDRSFVVRRALRINDALPSDDAGSARKSPEHWVWQRGPWLLVDRVAGKVTALKLPDYDPGASQVAWFRDYAAYCGVTATRKSLNAVVAQIGIRKMVLSKKLAAYDVEDRPPLVCGLPEWQREPLRITFHPTGKPAASFDLVGGSAVLVEDGEEDDVPARP